MGDGSKSGGMGMKKHARSGHSPKGPKTRQAMKRLAEADVRGPKVKPIRDPARTVADAIKGHKRL